MSRIDEALRRASQGSALAPSAQEPREDPWIPPPALDRFEAGEQEMPLADFRPEEPEFRSDEPAAAPLDLRIAPPSAVVHAEPTAVLAEPARGNEKLVGSGTVEPVAIEQYRKLAVTLHQMQVDRGTRIVMIASAMASEGKTLTAANLALTLSESFKRKVLLIDADMRRPSIHDIFRIPNVDGLGVGLSAEGDQKLTLVEVTPHLTILPAGKPDPNPISGLTSERMRRILAEAAAKFDWVVVDTPPIGVLPDAKILAEMTDTVVLVIGAGTTPFKPIQRAVEALGRQRIAGVVLNRIAEPESTLNYYAHQYYVRADSVSSGGA
jgi:capsular exopolysaccharide synthesis family protein